MYEHIPLLALNLKYTVINRQNVHWRNFNALLIDRHLGRYGDGVLHRAVEVQRIL
jgi:hypothetical protein